jgi:hypothetical protein
METLRLILLVVHLLGFAALFGGLVVQARDVANTWNVNAANAGNVTNVNAFTDILR